MYEEELEMLGITSIEQNSILQQIKKVLKSPINLISSVGSGVYNFFRSINSKIQASRNQALHEFKQSINKVLIEFVEIDLAASENALHISRARNTRLKAMIENQKELTNKTEDNLDEEKRQLELEIFDDVLGFNDREDIKKLAFGNDL